MSLYKFSPNLALEMQSFLQAFPSRTFNLARVLRLDLRLITQSHSLPNRRNPVKHDACDPDSITLCRYRALVAEANDMPSVRGENKYLYFLAHERMKVLLQPSSSLGNVYKPHDTTNQIGVPSRFIALRALVASRSRSN
jgi:hypothetical protein